jgi:hypothetical protein
MLIDDVEEPERTVDQLVENFKLGLEKLTDFRESLKEVV